MACGMVRVADDLSSVDRKGSNYQDCEVLFPTNTLQVNINKQSPDSAGGVDLSKDDLDFGAGDQGIMFEYATDETENLVLLTGLMATRLGKKLSNVRENGDLWRLRPHGKTQVTIEHVQGTDGSLDPRKIHTVVTRKNNHETVVRDVVKNIRADSGTVKGLITALINKLQSETSHKFNGEDEVNKEKIERQHSGSSTQREQHSKQQQLARQAVQKRKEERKEDETEEDEKREEREEEEKGVGEKRKKERERASEKAGWEGKRRRRK